MKTRTTTKAQRATEIRELAAELKASYPGVKASWSWLADMLLPDMMTYAREWDTWAAQASAEVQR